MTATNTYLIKNGGGWGDNSLNQSVTAMCLHRLCWNPEGAGTKKVAPGSRYHIFSVET